MVLGTARNFLSPKEKPTQKGEWGFFIGFEHDTPNHLRAWLPHHPGIYSRRKFIPHSDIPKGWNMKPRYNPLFKDDNGISETFEEGSVTENVDVQKNEEQINLPNVDTPNNIDDELFMPREIVNEPLPRTEHYERVEQQKNKPKKSTENVQTEPKPTRERLPRAAKEKNFLQGPVKMRNTEVREKIFANRISIQNALQDKGNLQLTREAIYTEIRNFFDNKAISPVYKRNIDGHIINALLFLVDKFDSMGNFIKKKGRAAMRGYQIRKEFIGRTDSPTVNPGSLNTLITLAACDENSKLEAYDIVAAFLGTPMQEGKRISFSDEIHN